MFKHGDKVVCISRRDGMTLEIGKEYTVKRCYKGQGAFFVRVEEIEKDHNYLHTRFKLAEISLENK